MKRLLLSTLFTAALIAPSFAADPGAAAPAFEGTTLKSEKVSLASLKGKIVVLEWANFDCPFVKKHYASGNMAKLQEEYTGKGVVWITVNSSAEGKQGYLPASEMSARATKEGNKASHFVMDTSGTIGKAYAAKVTPHMFIINAEGKIAYNGAMDSVGTTKAEDITTAEPLFKNALDAVLAGAEVAKAKNNPYGCGVKY
jgi:peroxiredoxin